VVEVLFAQTIPAPYLGEGALAGLVSLLILSWLNEWLVSGKLYRAEKADAKARLDEEIARSARELERANKEIEYWRGMALTNLGLAEKAVTLAEGKQP
jgi:hypothetical protein